MIIFLISGKRKSGKDYIANFMREKNPDIEIYRLSEPLKSEYAKAHNLDLQQLLSSSEYKEKYRKEMVEFGQAQRKQNPAYFCEKIAFKNSDQIAMNVIADVRRKTDIAYFKNKYSDPKNHKVVTVRLDANLETREKRGFVFDAEVDEQETECDLDDFDFDFLVENHSTTDDETLEGQFLNIFEVIAEEIDNDFEDLWKSKSSSSIFCQVIHVYASSF